ncbi:hypothetical protein MYU51_018835 [Penicillium brevicompactum]
MPALTISSKYKLGFCLRSMSSCVWTFGEDGSVQVAIRLPCPEINFQNGQPIIMEFLPEALAASAAPAASAFTECIIAATISGRVLSHRHHCEVGDIYQNSLEDLWTQHEWINTMHNQWMQNFFSACAVEMQQSDPMALFIALIFLITRLHLHETALLIGLAVNKQDGDLLQESRKRAILTTQHIVNLTKELSKLSSFQIHPLTSIPLSLCVEFLVSNDDFGQDFAAELWRAIDTMQLLKSFDNIGKRTLPLREDSSSFEVVQQCFTE